MKLKSFLSILLILLVGHGCKQVYEVEVPQTSSNEPRYYVPFVNTNTGDNLGVIVSDTNKRDINFFYGTKSEKGYLIDVQQIVSYLPTLQSLVSFELGPNLLPQKITLIKKDTTQIIVFKNYDLARNTVDVEVLNTAGIAIFNKNKVPCGDALLKFAEAKKQFALIKSLRIGAETSTLADNCSMLAGVIDLLTNAIGCLVGGVLWGAGIIATGPTLGIGLIGVLAGGYFTLKSCLDFFNRLNDGICLEFKPLDLAGKLSVDVGCWGAVEAVFKRNPTQILAAIGCINSIINALNTIFNERLNTPTTPTLNDPVIPTEVFEGGRSFGDPNIVTFDGSPYGFNGAGEFVAVKSTTDNFEIQVRQEELKNRSAGGSVSWNTGLAINTGSDRLCFYPNKYFINGAQFAYNANINHTLAGGGNVSGDSRTITVSNNTGDIIKVFNQTDMLNYSLIPSIQRQGKLIGIFGDYNKDAANDLKLRNGTPIDGSYASLYPTYTDSWRITQAQSLFVYDAGKNTNSYTDRTFPRSPLAMTAAQRASAEQTCRNAGVQPPFLEGCINDVVATGNANSAQWAKALQEETVLRSFDIKFGEKEDKSLLFPNYRNRVALNYADNYLILGWASEELLLSKPIKIGKGFDFVFYLSNEIKEKNNLNIVRIRFSQLFGSFNTPLSFFINIFRDSNRYAVGDEFSGDNLPSKTPNIFDGKIHKIQLRYEFNPSYNRLTRKLWIDEIDVVSTIVNIPNNLSYKIERLKTNSFNPVFPLFETSINELGYYENTSRLYRWSFKSL